MTPQENRNFRHLVLDIFWFGLAIPATARFLAVYAIRVDASPLELSLITALPALILLLAATLSTWWSRHFPDAARAIVLPGLGHRLAFLLPALTPFFPHEWQPIWLILAVSIPALPQGIASVVFMVLMREAVPVDRLTHLISRRYIAMNSAIGLSTLVFGLWLTRTPFPQNYQAMFVIGFAATLISLWHVDRTRSINVTPPPAQFKQQAAPWQDQDFRRVLRFAFTTQLAFFIVFPFIPYYLVYQFGADEQFVSMFVLVELLGGIVISLYSPQVSNTLGQRNMIALGMIGTALSSIAIALSPTLMWTMAGAVLNGVAWTMVGTGLFAYFNNQVPEHAVTRYTILYNQITFGGIFIGPLIGSILIDLDLPLTEVLLTGSGLRLLVGLTVSDLHLRRWAPLYRRHAS